ncbi:MAG TPA: 2TM domain-containing protein [Flavobacterium sp.]
MDNPQHEQNRYERAKKRARSIRSFYINLICYCIVIPSLAVLNLIYSPEFWWFLFSAAGWGIGLSFHAMGAFNYNSFWGHNWEQRKLEELLKKENQSKKQ